MRLQDIDQYLTSLSERLAPRTVAGICSSLRAFLRYLHAKGLLDTDLFVSVVFPAIRTTDRPPQVLPWDTHTSVAGRCAIQKKIKKNVCLSCFVLPNSAKPACQELLSQASTCKLQVAGRQRVTWFTPACSGEFRRYADVARKMRAVTGSGAG
jgi:hypothetical protein